MGQESCDKDCGTPSLSQAQVPMSTPDGPCKGVGSQQWVQHFQVHHDGHGHRYPSRPLMDPAKPATEMIAVRVSQLEGKARSASTA